MNVANKNLLKALPAALLGAVIAWAIPFPSPCQAAEQHFIAPPSFSVTTKVPNQLIIVPQQTVNYKTHDPYALYAVYEARTNAIVAAFPTRQAAALYSWNLVVQGTYSGYSFAPYENFAKYGEH